MNNTNRTAELEDLKRQVDILDLAERLGMELRGRQARCFNSQAHKHNDSHFSLGLDNSTNRYKCFTCENKGSVIDLYMAIKGVEFKQALEELKNMYGIYSPVTSYPKVYKPTNTQEPAREPVNTEDNKAIYRLFMDLCNGVDAKAKEYLLSRGLTEETIERFKLFSIHDYSELNKSLKETLTPDQLQGAGLTGDKHNLIFYKHTLITPFLDGENIVFMQARRLDNEHPKYLLLKNISIPLYNSDTLKGMKKGERVFICEGVYDAMIMEQEGKKAVAILGVNNFKPEWVEQFANFEVVLALDNDEAGRKATDTLAKLFYLKGIKTKTIELPQEAKDITEFYLQP